MSNLPDDCSPNHPNLRGNTGPECRTCERAITDENPRADFEAWTHRPFLFSSDGRAGHQLNRMPDHARTYLAPGVPQGVSAPARDHDEWVFVRVDGCDECCKESAIEGARLFLAHGDIEDAANLLAESIGLRLTSDAKVPA